MLLENGVKQRIFLEPKKKLINILMKNGKKFKERKIIMIPSIKTLSKETLLSLF